MLYVINCVGCGEQFRSEKSQKKYCPECMKLSPNKRTEMRKKREHTLKDAEEAALKKKRRLQPFDLTGKSLRRVDAEAKLFGLSYGQYTAAIRGGTIELVLKHKGFNNPEKMLKDLKVE